MPKRPSALTLTPDGQTILCGDKFGDAYSLPLFPGEFTPRVESAKAYKPAATNLTVHSKRNLESLEQQRLEAERSAKKETVSEEKVSIGFEHHMILGHVSLLTDLIAVSLPTATSANRSYILTADRDEHIRVSRGLPQSHVIEKYCLGHTSFISKLCIPSWAPQYLVSGGGDNFLILWKWNEGQALQKVSLEGFSQAPEISVRNIWAVSPEQPAGPSVQAIMVGLEGYVPLIPKRNTKANTHRSSPALLCYTIEEDTLKHQDTIQLSGNILDVTTLDSRGSIIVSVDNNREPGSTETWRNNVNPSQALLETFQVTTDQGSLKWKATEDALATSINAAGTSAIPTDIDDKKKKTFDSVLYSSEVLRKRHHDE